MGLSIQLWLSTELSGKIGTLTLLALFVLVAVEMGFIGTLLDLMKLAMLRLLLVVNVFVLLGIPIFPVCQEYADWAKEQYCLCCTIFLKVRLILGPQGCLAGRRACR